MVDYGTGGGVQKLKDEWSLFDAEFLVKALSIGYALRITWVTPHTLSVLDWNGRVRILRKTDEWPQSWDDPDAEIVSDEVTVAPTNNEITQSDLAQGKIFYYTLFMQRTDGYWIEDKVNNRQSAYPYDRWGNTEYMFGSLPKGWQIDDGLGTEDLYNFMRIFGALADNMKTDTENLLTLFSAEEVHADLLWMIDAKLYWPTWGAIGAIQQRKETLRAVDNYKLFGTEPGYESILQEASGWDVEVYEGWRYVMFTNWRFGCTTPDTTDSQLLPNVGTITDLLKYVNDGNGWHAVSGLAFELTDVVDVSAALTAEMVDRWYQLIDFSKASYVTYGIVIAPLVVEETILLPEDDWDESDDIVIYPELILVPDEEDLGWEGIGITLFLTNDLSSTTNTVDDRIFHAGMSY